MTLGSVTSMSKQTCSTCCHPASELCWLVALAAACGTMLLPEALHLCAQMSSAQLQVFSQAMGSIRDCILTAQARYQGAAHAMSDPCQGPCMQASVKLHLLCIVGAKPDQSICMKPRGLLIQGQTSAVPGIRGCLDTAVHLGACHTGHHGALAWVSETSRCYERCASTTSLSNKQKGSCKLLMHCLLLAGPDMLAEQRASQQPHPAEAGRQAAAQILRAGCNADPVHLIQSAHVNA